MEPDRLTLMRRWSSDLPDSPAIWNGLCADYGHEAHLLECAVFTAYARLIVEWQSQGRTADVAHILGNTEYLLRDAELAHDHDLRGLVGVCFLESIQNLALNGYADYQAFEQELGPRTRDCWEEIERLWEGDALVAPQLFQALVRGLHLVAASAAFAFLGILPILLRRWFSLGDDQ